MESPRIEDLITYNPETGEFKWLDPKGRARKGWFSLKPRGQKNKNYIRSQSIQIKGKWYAPSRLAWYLMKCEWPIVIDHINRNALDNRFENLRNVSAQDNFENTKGRGWRYAGTKFSSYISVHGKQIYLGVFDTKEEAESAYMKAKKEYHKSFIYE